MVLGNICEQYEGRGGGQPGRWTRFRFVCRYRRWRVCVCVVLSISTHTRRRHFIRLSYTILSGSTVSVFGADVRRCGSIQVSQTIPSVCRIIVRLSVSVSFSHTHTTSTATTHIYLRQKKGILHASPVGTPPIPSPRPPPKRWMFHMDAALDEHPSSLQRKKGNDI